MRHNDYAWFKEHWEGLIDSPTQVGVDDLLRTWRIITDNLINRASVCCRAKDWEKLRVAREAVEMWIEETDELPAWPRDSVEGALDRIKTPPRDNGT